MKTDKPSVDTVPTGKPVSRASRFKEALRKAAYGTGAVPEGILNQGMQQFGNNVFTIILGVNPALVGLSLSIARLWDAIFDPVVGNWSDKMDTRWGRRKPLMLVGILGAAAVFVSMFFASPDWSDTVKFAFLMAGTIIFFSFATMYCIPFLAMGYEYTEDYDERSRLMAYRAVMAPLAAFIIMWLFPLSQSGIFSSPIVGARYVATGIAVLFIALALVPILFVPNRKVKIDKKPKMNILAMVKKTVTNKPFLYTLVPCVIVAMSINYRAQFFLYVNVYHVFGGDLVKGSTFAATVFTISQILAMLLAPAFAALATHTSKKQAMCIVLSLITLGSLSSYVLMTPKMPYLAVLPQLLVDPAIAAIFMLYHSMIADVCDLDELETGSRREGIFGAVAGWVYKTGSSLAVLLSGVGLWLGGFDVANGANQTAKFISSARIQFALIPAIAGIIGILVFRKYPITREIALDVRRQLDSDES
jgi:GPH family glycoside/pentoside/hexuronide:cation symporter